MEVLDTLYNTVSIGPHYFSPGDFWGCGNSQRFTLEFSSEDIVRNLNILDKYFNGQSRE
jgi:hypothetical protein